MTRSGDENDQVRRLRERLAVLRREAEENEAIFRRAQQRELRLLQADSLVSLFDEIAEGLRRSHTLTPLRWFSSIQIMRSGTWQ
jgi:uncharacterized protein YigA (DUF484 family)